MKVAYVTSYDAQSIRSWSGIPYYMSHALRDVFGELDYIGPLTIKKSTKLRFRFKQMMYTYFLKKRCIQDAELSILKGFAKQANRKLATLDHDVLFSPVSYTIAYLECKKPIVLWADATFAGLIDYYPFHSNLCKESIGNGIAMEQSAFDKCTLAIFSSDWAAKTAIKNYRIDPNKVKVVSYGANIDCNRNIDDIQAIVNSKSVSQCNLLFLGVKWFRKGGDVALEVAKKLNQLGLNTQLTIIGCEPITDTPLPDFVKHLGFISKSTEEGRRKIEQAFLESHFLILPSIADCTPIVFSEANSFGMPCLSVNTGGISTIIRSDINGKVFSRDSVIEECCSYISNLFTNYSLYEKLALSSFSEYQSRLNWSVAAKTVKQLFMQTMA